MHETPAAAAPADVYSIRRRAVRILEEHRQDSGFTHERLRELVELELFREGQYAPADLVVEAIRAMLPSDG